MGARATSRPSTGATVRYGNGQSRESTATWQDATGRSEQGRLGEGCPSRGGSARGSGYSRVNFGRAEGLPGRGGVEAIFEVPE